MPRTRSTAVLQACLRTTKINEPFNPNYLPCFSNNLHLGSLGPSKLVAGKHSSKHVTLQKLHLYATYYNRLDNEWISNLLQKLDSQDTAIKFFGFDLVDFLPARNWLERCSEHGTHDIFVLTRDLREQMFSYVLAPIFGYRKDKEIEPYSIYVDSGTFYYLKKNIDSFLRFLPRRGKLITFDQLPETHFDKTSIKIEDQNSLMKIEYIKNLDECEYHIDELIKYFKPIWGEAINKLL